MFRPQVTEKGKLHYQNKVSLYYRPLATLLRLRIDPTTASRWAELILLGREIDDYVDAPQLSSAALHSREQEVLSWLPDPQNLADSSLPNLAKLEIEHLACLTRKASEIFNLNREFKSATTVSEFTPPRAEEGRVYAQMILDCATAQVVNQPNFQRFSRILIAGGAALNLANSARGLRGDYLAGQTSLSPTFSNTAALITTAVTSLTTSAPKLHGAGSERPTS